MLQPERKLKTPILIVGGSTAAYGAALAVMRQGQSAIWVQPGDRIGGQYTAQLVASGLDDRLPEAQEAVALSRSHRALRQRRRALQRVAGKRVSNPGGAWGATLSTTPAVSAQAMEAAIAPYLETQQLQVFSQSDPVAVLKEELPGQRRRVVGVTFRDRATETRFTVLAQVVIEATDLGDLLELGEIESRIGQESRQETGEAVLPETAYPQCQQPFTWAALVEFTAPGQGQPVPPPAIPSPEGDLSLAAFTADLWMRDARQGWQRWDFLGSWGLFRYGRVQRSQPSERPVAPGDVTVLAWGAMPTPTGDVHYGNEYRGGPLVGVSRQARERHWQQARDRTLAYLHFLQTQVTPDLRLRGDLAGTSDGLAQAPYIREARRGIALKTIRHEDISAQFFETPRATCFPDSVGIGSTPFIHLRQTDAEGQVQLPGQAAQVRPFSLPARALVPIATDGLILSAKNLGTTHITNAVYGLPLVEWAIGEASGMLAAFAVQRSQPPREIVSHTAQIRQMQALMARDGIPLFWFDDVPHDDPDFEPIQLVAVMGLLDRQICDTLHFQPETIVSRAQAATILVTLLQLPTMTPATPTFQDVLPGNHWAYLAIETLYSSGIAEGVGGDRFAPHQPITRATFATWIRKAVPEAYAPAFQYTPVDTHYLRRRELARILYPVAMERYTEQPFIPTARR